jgi:hypothetical protein
MNASLRENHLTLIYLLESGLVTVDDIIPAAPEPATLPTWHERWTWSTCNQKRCPNRPTR